MVAGRAVGCIASTLCLLGLSPVLSACSLCACLLGRCACVAGLLLVSCALCVLSVCLPACALCLRGLLACWSVCALVCALGVVLAGSRRRGERTVPLWNRSCSRRVLVLKNKKKKMYLFYLFMFVFVAGEMEDRPDCTRAKTTPFEKPTVWAKRGCINL